MQKTVYQYSTGTGEYTGTTIAYENPKRPGEYMLPANTTEIEPPVTGEHETAVWHSGKWEIVPDYRNIEIRNIETAEKIEKQLGENIEENEAIVDYEMPEFPVWSSEEQKFVEDKERLLTDRKEKKKAETKTIFLRKIEEGCECSCGICMNADIADIEKLENGYQYYIDTGSTEMSVRDYDNAMHTISIDVVATMIKEMRANYMYLLQKKWQIQDTIESLQTVEEVENYNIKEAFE